MTEITLSKLPEISTLYPSWSKIRVIEPVGLGTKKIESLSSYITRLAETHRLRTRVFLSLLVSVSDNKALKSYSKTNPRNLYSINGANDNAKTVTQVLNEIDVGFDSRLLTYLPIKGSVEQRAHGLIDNYQKWCKQCWRDSISNNEELYVPLSWTCKQYKLCTTHMRWLSSVCFKCGDTQKIIPSLPCIEFCQQCGQDLMKGKLEPEVKTRKDAESIWNAENIEDLILQTNGGEYFIKDPPVPAFLNDIINHHWQGQIGNFSKALGFPNREVVSHWLKGNKKPHLRNIMNLSYHLKIPLFEILSGKTSPLVVNKPLITLKSTKHRYTKRLRTSDEIKVIKTTIKKRLKDMRENKNHISASGLAAELDCTIEFFRNRFPDYYYEIKQLYAVHRQEKTVAKKKEVRRIVADACAEMIDEGIYPTERKLKEEYKVSVSVVRRVEAREELKNFQSIFLYVD